MRCQWTFHLKVDYASISNLVISLFAWLINKIPLTSFPHNSIASSKIKQNEIFLLMLLFWAPSLRKTNSCSISRPPNPASLKSLGRILLQQRCSRKAKKLKTSRGANRKTSNSLDKLAEWQKDGIEGQFLGRRLVWGGDVGAHGRRPEKGYFNEKWFSVGS